MAVTGIIYLHMGAEKIARHLTFVLKHNFVRFLKMKKDKKFFACFPVEKSLTYPEVK